MAESRNVALADGRSVSAKDGDSIVVTGSRLPAPAAAAPITRESSRDAHALGPWNACTALDPRRDVRGCSKRLPEPVAEGLLQAWQGNLATAANTLTRAIKGGRQDALVYLNRGLVHQMRGDPGMARADLDRAIESDSTLAAAWYHRSLLQRARGDDAAADADLRRAILLDGQFRRAPR